METIWDKVISESELLSLPEIYLKLQQVINSDDYSMSDVVDVISFDPALTARLLRMVNSSFFGLAVKVDTVTHAINYLGTQQVHDLVLSTSVAQAFSQISNENFNLNQFWQQSVYCAIAARELAVLCNVLNSERLFVIGLLHDVGHLIMQQSIPTLMQQAHALAKNKNIPIYEAENQLIDFNFALVGSALLSKWNLPESLSVSIKNQLTPANAEEYEIETAILHIAATLTRVYTQNQSIEESHEQCDPGALELSNINLDNCIMVDKMARENLSKVISLLLPQYRIAV